VAGVGGGNGDVAQAANVVASSCDIGVDTTSCFALSCVFPQLVELLVQCVCVIVDMRGYDEGGWFDDSVCICGWADL